MTSQLNVDTIVDKAGSGGSNVKMANTSTYVSDGGGVTQNTVQGLAKSWVNFDGSESPLTNRDSFNVSSLVDNGTGNYDQVFTNNMSSGNYSPSGAGADTQPISGNRDRNFQITAENTAQTNINFFLSSQQDMNHVHGQVFGDLA